MCESNIAKSVKVMFCCAHFWGIAIKMWDGVWLFRIILKIFIFLQNDSVLGWLYLKTLIWELNHGRSLKNKPYAQQHYQCWHAPLAAQKKLLQQLCIQSHKAQYNNSNIEIKKQLTDISPSNILIQSTNSTSSSSGGSSKQHQKSKTLTHLRALQFKYCTFHLLLKILK